MQFFVKPIWQWELWQDVLTRNEALSENTRALVSGVSEQQLLHKPDQKTWSVAQILEHLCVANDDYLRQLRPLVGKSSGQAPASVAQQPWTPTLAGRFLVHSMASPRNLPAPSRWKPAREPRSGTLSEFLVRQDEISSMIRESQPFPWSNMRTRSPITPLIRLNLGDCFAILVSHGERHLRQMQSVVKLVTRSPQ